MSRTKALLVVLAAVSAGCGSKAAKKQSLPPAPASADAAAITEAKPVAASPNVAVSDDIAARCALRFASVEQAPKFGFDEADLLPDDRRVLEQIAECLVRGPLQGRTVQLIGRADPRGTDEYNLGLGTRRAQSVQTFLQRLGVPATRLAPTTRGDTEASGTDETGWQRDRRVDLQLVN